MKTLKFIVIALVCASSYPALALTPYLYGGLPASAADADLTTAYTNWKNRWVKTGYCSNSLRVDNGTSPWVTYSEGIGYGMLMAAYLDSDSTNLTKFYNYYYGNKDGYGLMNWRVADNYCGNNKENAASDGDVDMAQAMVEAHHRWPAEGWDAKAKAMLDIIYSKEIDSCKGLKPGEGWGGCSAGASGKAYNPSYSCTSYFKNWDCFEGNTRWSAVRDQTYAVLNGISGALPPDWVGSSGAYFNNGGNSATYGGYYYDSCRTPWRVGMDYLWFGDSRALALSNKWAGNFNVGGAGAPGQTTVAQAAAYIMDGYNYSTGARTGIYHQNEFVGAVAVSAMASNAAFSNACYTELKNKDSYSYFGDSLKVIYLMVLTGRFQDAACGSTCLSCTPTYTNTGTNTFTPTQTRTSTPTWTSTLTTTGTSTRTSTWTPTLTYTPVTPGITPEPTNTKTDTPIVPTSTWTDTPVTPGVTPEPTNTWTDTPVTPVATLTPTNTWTNTPLISPTLTYTQGIGSYGDGGKVIKVVPVPNPNPLSISLFSQGGSQHVTLTLYNVGYIKVAQYSGGPIRDGWDSIALPAVWAKDLPSGVYFVGASAGSSQSGNQPIGKALIRH